MAATTNQQSASVIITDDPRTRAKAFFFAMCPGAATKNGHRFLTDTQSARKGQVLYHGFTRPREATTPISTAPSKGRREDRGAGSQKSPRRSRL
jgi:hypothetical protein